MNKNWWLVAAALAVIIFLVVLLDPIVALVKLALIIIGAITVAKWILEAVSED